MIDRQIVNRQNIVINKCYGVCQCRIKDLNNSLKILPRELECILKYGRTHP